MFYKPVKLAIDGDLPNRFIGVDRSSHAVYRRAPVLDGRLAEPLT